ncbi:ferrochelatase mitochondrial precursor [Nadsonia fulvescens var. elongata DSM 6958]|uniref:Ferrochelatase n=1 Tax=Nadsonia fulvescens var. elongata DSM 6958 TaxID=857566 RepID=A0A1E3PSP5_9ASCO|nr:ferrochelatase mitochondrial precursor [Nadsonia fulvescens var. elongata DSM 6958]
MKLIQRLSAQSGAGRSLPSTCKYFSTTSRVTNVAEATPSTSNETASSIASLKGPTAVVLLNMGGPSTLPEVGDFLYRLFSDKDIIPLGRFQEPLARFITYRRTPKITQSYKEIGGGSPIRKWSEYQAKKACELLDKVRPASAPHKPYVAFRYANPLTPELFENLKRDGIKRAIAFSQYPQYSCATTGSSINELSRLSKEYDPNNEIEWSLIDRWPTHPGFVEAVSERIQAALQKLPAEVRSEAVLLFSAHSLPMDVVNRGDPYPAEVAATVWAVMQNLGLSNPYRLTWQSQVGPKAWLGPQTADAVKTLDLREDCKGIVLIPIAFTSDHIETSHELDIEIIGEVKNPEKIVRAESLNGSDTFTKAMADIVVNHLNDYDQKRSTSALNAVKFVRCPMCTSDRCGPSRDLFEAHNKQ